MRTRRAGLGNDRPYDALKYLSGFGNFFASEARAGALPEGRNSPQRPPHGLYAEVLSGTAFTAPRAENRSAWLYKLRPSAMHGPYRRVHGFGDLRSGPFDEAETPPNRLRWNPFPIPEAPTDFVDGLLTLAGSGDPASQSGLAVHLYRANRSMERVLWNADGEMMFVPQQGSLNLFTELGRLAVSPGEIAVIPRGMKFRVELIDGALRGYVCENYGAAFRLPELGPIGSQGLAQVRDFQSPVAAYEDTGPCEVLSKFMGGVWTSEFQHSPLDVVAWRGNYAPYKYDLARFMTLNTVSYDHPDPSIFTVLTSPSGAPGVANCDFVIFPPRWLVAEGTFRPPWFHRNVMSELMGLVHGVYDAKAEGFLPGGVSIHNCLSAHGPDVATFEKASAADLKPHKIDNTLAFMWESRYVFRPTRRALSAPELQSDYDQVWDGFRNNSGPGL